MNDWNDSDLRIELNGDYLNTALNANTYWYNNFRLNKTAVYDYTKGLKTSAQGLISNAKWYLGGVSLNNNASSYVEERGTTVWGSTTGQTCDDDSCPRATTWTGEVALPYPSDYGYAVGGTARSTCLGKTLNSYQTDACHQNDWLRPYIKELWLLSPRPDSNTQAHYINTNGSVYSQRASEPLETHPTVYLKTSAVISGGNGTISTPYTLG